jgi:hypothetical protein
MYTEMKTNSTPKITGSRPPVLSEKSSKSNTTAEIKADIMEMFTAICLGEEVLIIQVNCLLSNRKNANGVVL